MLTSEENFIWHLQAFASEVFIFLHSDKHFMTIKQAHFPPNVHYCNAGFPKRLKNNKNNSRRAHTITQ